MNKIVAALYDRAMANLEAAGLYQWRRDLLAGLAGRVVEIGAGTGRNLELEGSKNSMPEVRGSFAGTEIRPSSR